jgi:hypothetical protein
MLSGTSCCSAQSASLAYCLYTVVALHWTNLSGDFTTSDKFDLKIVILTVNGHTVMLSHAPSFSYTISHRWTVSTVASIFYAYCLKVCSVVQRIHTHTRAHTHAHTRARAYTPTHMRTHTHTPRTLTRTRTRPTHTHTQ